MTIKIDRADCRAALESLKVQGLGLLNRGEASDEEVNAFKDVGQTLLSGTIHSLIGADTVSGVDANTDLELTLETLDGILDRLDQEEPSAFDEEDELETLDDLTEIRQSLEDARLVGSKLSEDEKRMEHEERHKVEGDAVGGHRSLVASVVNIATAPIRHIAKKAGQKIGEKLSGALSKDTPAEVAMEHLELNIAVVDRAIERLRTKQGA